MTKRWPTHCLCAALLLMGMVAFSGAKPPDLPSQEKVNCRENDPSAQDFGSGPVPTGAIEIEQEFSPIEEIEAPIDNLYPWLGALMSACERQAEVWFEDSTQPSHCRTDKAGIWVDVSYRFDTAAQAESGCPVCQALKSTCACVCQGMKVCAAAADEAVVGEAQESTSKSSPTAGTDCPYMIQQQAQSCATTRSMPPAATPLDNLKKLQQAQKLIHEAERAEKANDATKALELYSKVQYLCPGSRLAAVAQEHVQSMMFGQSPEQPTTAASEEQDETPAPKKPVVTPAAPNTCPFLIEKDAARKVPKAEPIEMGNALDNLKKLEKAQKVLHDAEGCIRAGKTEQALALFEQVHLLCPGSTIDATAIKQQAELNERLVEARALMSEALQCVLAQNYDDAAMLYQRLVELYPQGVYGQLAADHLVILRTFGLMQQASTTESAEEESKQTECEREKIKCIEERVAELLEDCHRAVADGRYAEAAALAKKASALDPDCVAASAMVYKMHVLIQVQERRAREAKKGKKSAAAPVQLRPHMPPVDPCVVQDFERALTARQEEVQAARGRAVKVAVLLKQFQHYYKDGKYRQALRMAELAHRIDPDNVAADAAVGLARIMITQLAAPEAGGAEESELSAPRRVRKDEPPQAGHEDLSGTLCRYLHDRTGVEVKLTSGTMKVQCAYHCGGASCCLCAAAEGIYRCLAVLPISLRVEMNTPCENEDR